VVIWFPIPSPRRSSLSWDAILRWGFGSPLISFILCSIENPNDGNKLFGSLTVVGKLPVSPALMLALVLVGLAV